jgi:hypothetical protein
VSDRGFFLTLHAVRRQLAAMPNELYFIRLIDHSTRRVCPGERLWDAGQSMGGSTVRFLRARNREGYDVYPFSTSMDRVKAPEPGCSTISELAGLAGPLLLCCGRIFLAESEILGDFL